MLFRKIDDAHEFKPILAEIEDEPVSPMARLILWIVIVTLCFFVAWSILGVVDVVVTAPGKVIPNGRIKVIQPLDTGVVSEIMVSEGDFVHKGQRLVRIDPAMTASELDSTNKNLGHTDLEIKRLQSTLSGRRLDAPKDADPSAVLAQQQLCQAARSALAKQVASKEAELRRAVDEQKGTQADLDQNQELLKIAISKQARLKPVLDIIARDDWDRNESEIATYRGKSETDRHKLAELINQQAQLSADISRIRFDFETSNLKDLSERQKSATELTGKVKELSFKQRKQTIASPVDGYVDGLNIHSIGGVVTPAERLMSIVPANTPLLVQASVSNNDIGFVSAGMPVAIKADAFDFQKYGMYDGKVVSVARNSHDSESKQGAGDPSSRPEKKVDQVFEVYIEPTTKNLKVEGVERPLMPGMTLTAEIKTSKRRIIEFLIYPLIKYWHNGITVR